MTLPTNALQNVETYQKSNIGFLLNHNCFLANANKKFKDFDKIEANRGDTVTFELPPRFSTADSLIVSAFQATTQRKMSLVVDKAKNVSVAYSAKEFIFNVRDYMDRVGLSAMDQLGTTVEADVGKNCISGTYRFYGNGVDAINSYGQLADAVAHLKEFGSAAGEVKGYVNNLAVPSIVNTGLSQFVPGRNEEIANSWELGKWADASWYRSNLLPIHTAGNVGIDATVLTVTSVTTDPDDGISAITFSGAGETDANAIKQYDLLSFKDGVSGHTNVRYRTFIGQEPCGEKVQFAATANAGSDGAGNVVISINPKLYSAAGATQNVTQAIVAGMQVEALPSHRAGVLYSGNALYLAMPMLPSEDPFMTVNKTDPETGASIRMYYGSKFGEDTRGLVHDTIWGSTLVPEYSMRMVFPI